MDTAWAVVYSLHVDIAERETNRIRDVAWLCRYGRQDYAKLLELEWFELRSLMGAIGYWIEQESATLAMSEV
jgi:hypothetical protein